MDQEEFVARLDGIRAHLDNGGRNVAGSVANAVGALIDLLEEQAGGPPVQEEQSADAASDDTTDDADKAREA